MQTLSRICFIFLIASTTIASRDSLAQESKKENRGSISGRVTLEGKPVPRASVILTPAGIERTPYQAPPARTTTDEDGRYRFNGVAAGSYGVMPNSPTFVVAEASAGQGGQRVSVLEGEEVEDVNFTLKAGGVITGRVTDADGKPIINARVRLMYIDNGGLTFETPSTYGFKYMTDDRGVYRIYGLQPGRYKVSVGDDPVGHVMRPGMSGPNYSRTFHPDVAEVAKSPMVEVTAGIDATGIDITLGRVARSYVATGRIIDAETGAPMADVRYGYGALFNQKHIMEFGFVYNRTNPNGEFRIEGLTPGRFAAFMASQEETEFYGEPAVFEVVDGDVSGLEVKARTGSSISGVAVLEGVEDAEVLAKMSKLQVRVWAQSDSVSQPMFAPAKIGANGTFRIGGLQPGRIGVTIDGGYPPMKGFFLLRVERDGVEQPGGIEINAAEQISGIRLIIGYGTGVIRGQVKFQGGENPPNLRLFASVQRVGSTMTRGMAEVDSRGRFRVEALPAGEYIVTAVGNWPQPGTLRTAPPTQNVTVVNGAEVDVTLVVNLKPAGKEQ